MVPAKGNVAIRVIAVALLAAVGLAACQPGELTVVEPDGSDDGPSLGTLVAQVELRSADSALADSLGWESGVPGARIRILRNGTYEWLEVHSDSGGEAEFGEIDPGLYFTYVDRILTETEAENVSGRIRGFGDGRLIRVGAETVEARFELQSSTRSELVISEVSGAAPPPWEVPGAGFATRGNYFFEVYNQSNTTLYLDGRIFGTFPTELFCHGCANSCEFGAPVRTDSTGVHTLWMLSFPGSGNEYPINPGEVKLIAGAAQDHRELHEDMLDLRGADFEIGESRFADNPSVPNMRDVGPGPFFSNQLLAGKLYFLARPFDPSDLEQVWRSIRGSLYSRVPLSYITDLATNQSVWPDSDSELPPCQPIIHPNVDGFPGGFPNISELNVRSSFQREVLTTEDGIPILMDTNTSAADFSMMRYTPGALPDGGQ